MSFNRLLKIANQIDDVDRDWLLTRLEFWKDGIRLDVAFGLCGSTAMTNRNKALRKAAGVLDPNGTRSVWCVAGLLEAAILRFESRVLPRCRKSASIKISEIDMLLMEMFQPGGKPVRKQRQIYDCIK